MTVRKPIKKPGQDYSETKIRRALLFADIVSKHFEHGNAQKNLTEVWKKHVNPVNPCSINTYYKLLRIARKELKKIGKDFLPKD